MKVISSIGGEERKDLKVWFDGEFINYTDANVSIFTHSLQYGSAIFEGIRAYETDRGPAIFRLQDHIRRFTSSAKMYFIELAFPQKTMCDAAVELVRMNKLQHCYIRPFAFYNDQRIGVSGWKKKVSVYIAAVPFGAYFEGGAKGIRCKVSSWRRINSEILPVEAKASGNYLNSIIANFEAKSAGFDEAIFLSSNGYIAEGSGENIFLVKDNRLVTPDASADILMGITRESIIKMAESMDLAVEQRPVHKEELYSADEVFFTGTAAEVTPIVDVDGIKIGTGKVGPITDMLFKKFYDVVHGRDKKFDAWLTYVK